MNRRPLTESEYRLEGIVGAHGSFAPRRGPVTTDIACPDGAVWVIDYDEQSPYQAFVGRRIVAFGFPCEAPVQHRIATGHFAVSTMQLADVTRDTWLTKVGPGEHRTGRFESSIDAAGTEFRLSFVTDNGDRFRIANNPAGAVMGRPVNAWTYPVQFSEFFPTLSPLQSLWVICPCSYAELEELRDGPNGGLPSDVYLDAASGQIRSRI